MPADPVFVRQYEDLRKRCAKGQATPAACELLVKMQAQIDAQGGAPAGQPFERLPIGFGKPMMPILLVALGAYLLTIGSKFFRR